MRRALFLLLLATMPALAEVPEDVDPAFLTASVNGKATSVLATFWQRDSQWVADAAQWKALGIVLSSAESMEAELSAERLGIVLTVDDVELTVNLLVPVERLPLQRLGRASAMPELSSPAAGVLINYSLAGQFQQGQQSVSLGHEIRTANRAGVFSTSGQVNWTSAGGADYVRGETRWQLDDYTRQVTYQAGDVRSSGASSVGLGGVRIAKDPGLDPYTPIYPTPSIGGVALDPATVEILANRSKIAEHDVQRGNFTVERFPLRSGRNALDVVVRDAYGREQVVSSQSFYFSPRMLRPGLSTWSVAAGAVRQGYGDDYGRPGVSVEGARGLTDTWTVSGSAQSDGENHNAIVGARTVLGPAGVLDVQAGQSTGEQGSGSYSRVQYNYSGARVGVSLSHEQSDDFWQLLANDALGVRARERSQATITWVSPDRRWRARASATDMTTSLQGQDQRIRYAELGLGFQNGRHSLSGSALYDLDRSEASVQVGYRYDFGRGGLFATARQSPDSTRMTLGGSYHAEIAGQRVGVQGELAQVNGERHLRASADARLDRGTARASIQQQDGQTRVSGEFSGAVHLGTGGATWLPTVSSSYAVVDIAGVEGVTVRAEGRTIGRTNRAGRIIVPNIPSSVESTIRIDDKSLPPGVQLETSQLKVAPRRLAGGSASFRVLSHNGRAFTVRRATPIEVGATVKSETEETMVGFDGALYLEQPVAGQELTITDAAGSCVARVPDALPQPDEQPTLECQQDGP